MTAAGRLRQLARMVREDVAWAAESLVMTDLGGSKWIPRVARMGVLRLAGSKAGSAPGFGFTFAGDPRNLSIARGTYFNQEVFVEAIAPVSIGAGCAFGMQAMVLTSHHPLDARGSWRQEAEGLPVTIGDRVWVGARAVILPGVVVEDDVVVAAGAVVTRRCESGGVYAGVPARRIRSFGGPEEEHA